MKLLNTCIALLGLFLLSTIPSKTQVSQPTCVWISQGGTTPNFTCIDIKSLIPVAAPVQGGVCTVPTTGITLYAQDPITKNCYPLVPVAAPGFTATNISAYPDALPDNPQTVRTFQISYLALQ